MFARPDRDHGCSTTGVPRGVLLVAHSQDHLPASQVNWRCILNPRTLMLCGSSPTCDESNMTIHRIHLIAGSAFAAFLSCASATAQSLYSLDRIPPVTRPGPGDKHCAKPVYPKSSLRYEEQGTVTVSYLVDVDGAILDSRIVTSSGYRALDKEAFYSLAICQFRLPMGVTEPQWTYVQYVWSIQDRPLSSQ